jgi:hypothetical protein
MIAESANKLVVLRKHIRNKEVELIHKESQIDNLRKEVKTLSSEMSMLRKGLI